MENINEKYILNSPRQTVLKTVANSNGLSDNFLKVSKSKYKHEEVEDINYFGVKDKKFSTSFQRRMNLIYITNRILFTDNGKYDKHEFEDGLRSLKCNYGTNMKVLYLSVQTNIYESHQNTDNTLYSFPFLMPFIRESFDFLQNARFWLQKSKKNIILLVGKKNSTHLLNVFLKYIIFIDEINHRLCKPESIILLEHETNALIYYVQKNFNKIIDPSIKRYVTTISNIQFGIISPHLNKKHLYHMIIKKKLTNQNKGKIDLSHLGNIQTISISIYEHYNLVYTSYGITLKEDEENDQIIYIVNPILPIEGDISIFANATDKSGFQYIVFCVQFHTCWIKGESVSFQISDLDLIEKGPNTSLSAFELYFKYQVNILKGHEHRLVSKKYLTTNQNKYIKDILLQLNLIEMFLKRNSLNYNAEPIKENINANDQKQKYLLKDENRDLIDFDKNAINKTDILKKFIILEKEISSASEILNKYERPNPNNNIFQNSNKKSKKNSIKLSVLLNNSNNNCNNRASVLGDNLPKQFKTTFSFDVRKISDQQIKTSDKKVLIMRNNNCLYNSINSSRTENVVTVKENSLRNNSHFLSSTNFNPERIKVLATQHIWYKPNFTRQKAILYLMNKTDENFLIRASMSLRKSLSITIRCPHQCFENNIVIPDDLYDIQHFIIDINSEGYKIRNFQDEKYYKSLSHLVYDHVENSINLPCKLILPKE